MKLSAPKTLTWWVAVLVGGLGILAKFVLLPYLTINAFWLVAVGFVLLVIATFFKGI